jgi:hypothetical protein
MRVRVHFNLHRRDFSVIDPSTGRVIRNTDTITLRDVEFRVSEKGRQRVIRTRCRMVHAYAIGTITEHQPLKTACTYNPYRAGHFHRRGYPDQPVWTADVVTFSGGYCWI